MRKQGFIRVQNFFASPVCSLYFCSWFQILLPRMGTGVCGNKVTGLPLGVVGRMLISII
ncbi:uncharacterized protein BO66DRAFT_388400, partial [Aspergillus aculeatinus CBS 121060]